MTHLCHMMAHVRILLRLLRYLLDEIDAAASLYCVFSLESSDIKAMIKPLFGILFFVNYYFCVILHLSVVRLRNNLYICIDLG